MTVIQAKVRYYSKINFLHRKNILTKKYCNVSTWEVKYIHSYSVHSCHFTCTWLLTLNLNVSKIIYLNLPKFIHLVCSATVLLQSMKKDQHLWSTDYSTCFKHLDAFIHDYFFPFMRESWWVISCYPIRTMTLYHIVKDNIKFSIITTRIPAETFFAMPCTECSTKCSQSLSPSSLAVYSFSCSWPFHLPGLQSLFQQYELSRNKLFFPVFSIIPFLKCQKAALSHMQNQ